MQGTSATTSHCTKTVTSYTTSEILWGQRFKQCVSYNEETNAYYIDNNQFNKTEEVLTPLCSEKRLQEVLMDSEYCYSINENNNSNNKNYNIPIIELTTPSDRTDMCQDRNYEINHNNHEFIDKDVYLYLNDIKEKVNGKNEERHRMPQKPQDDELKHMDDGEQRCQRKPRSNSSNPIDVELLIDNLQKYVDDNVK